MNVKFLKTYVYLFSTSAPNIPLNKNCHLSSVINSSLSSRQKNFPNYLELSETHFIKTNGNSSLRNLISGFRTG